jgi:hypothetical protein
MDPAKVQALYEEVLRLDVNAYEVCVTVSLERRSEGTGRLAVCGGRMLPPQPGVGFTSDLASL